MRKCVALMLAVLSFALIAPAADAASCRLPREGIPGTPGLGHVRTNVHLGSSVSRNCYAVRHVIYHFDQWRPQRRAYVAGNWWSMTFYVHGSDRTHIDPYGVYLARSGRWWVKWEGYS